MKIFVGNISWNSTENDMVNHFERCGDIEECRIITDRETGRSRGFGFITFSEPEMAERAILELDGVELDGRPLKVNQARDRTPRHDRVLPSW